MPRRWRSVAALHYRAVQSDVWELMVGAETRLGADGRGTCGVPQWVISLGGCHNGLGVAVDATIRQRATHNEDGGTEESVLYS